MTMTSDSDERNDDGLPRSDVRIKVVVPEEFMGTAIGCINSHLGLIESLEHVSGKQAIVASVPARFFPAVSAEIEISSMNRAEITLLDTE